MSDKHSGTDYRGVGLDRIYCTFIQSLKQFLKSLRYTCLKLHQHQEPTILVVI